jgi:hypothetical protein
MTIRAQIQQSRAFADDHHLPAAQPSIELNDENGNDLCRMMLPFSRSENFQASPRVCRSSSRRAIHSINPPRSQAVAPLEIHRACNDHALVFCQQRK